jgi:APA family basic amino acid/polyamine antiporter
VAGADGLADATKQVAAPLEVIARGFGAPAVAWLVAVGAVTAMLGVLLNLVLGLSRVVLAMARRGDMPLLFARVDKKRSSPTAAVVFVGIVIAGLTAIGSVKTTWSFSAFTVLIYYALTNLAALSLPREARLYSRWIPIGLICCLGLAFWVEPRIWATGLLLIAVGLAWHRVAHDLAKGKRALST